MYLLVPARDNPADGSLLAVVTGALNTCCIFTIPGRSFMYLLVPARDNPADGSLLAVVTGALIICCISYHTWSFCHVPAGTCQG